MRRIAKLLALLTAFLVALPPGWCCAAPIAVGAPQQTPDPSVPPCCRGHEEKSSPTGSTPIPVHQRCRCCVVADQTTTVSKTPLPEIVATAILGTPPALPVTPNHAVVLDDGLLPDTSPPLHVLLCVWLC